MTGREDCHPEGGLDVGTPRKLSGAWTGPGTRPISRYPIRGRGTLLIRGYAHLKGAVNEPGQRLLAALLEGRDVPCFVRDSACGAPSHPAQLPRRGSRTVMVPAHCLSRAVEL